MDGSPQQQLRNLPAISELLEAARQSGAMQHHGQGATTMVAREVIERHRQRILSGAADTVPAAETIQHEIEAALTRLVQPQGRRAINGTGILLHTGLGRAPLPTSALDAFGVMAGYSVLQTDLETGTRCLREHRIESMLCELTGCQAATVVNNNAAATMLVLHALAEGREVIVSRGQLIEIGGSFRLPDVMAMSGATLRDIGCTNRTHLRDYASAIGEATGAMIHVHTSNYRVRGFHSTPGIAELAALGRERNIPVIDDLGSGALVSLRKYGLEEEPLVADSVRAGSTVACFSGDKLIGGPQAGIIVGKRDVIARIRKNPFARMFRVDKLTLAGLECALLHFLNNTYEESIPFYRMLSRPLDALEEQAERVAGCLPMQSDVAIGVTRTESQVGSGSIPDQGIPSIALSLTPESKGALSALARALRLGLPSVFARIHDERMLLDMRTVAEDDVEELIQALQSVLAAGVST